jgi:hypothetical protein
MMDGTQSMKSNQTDPVFVVGFFRSGSSLLYCLLNQHPQVALMYEWSVWDFPEILSPIRFRGDWLGRQEFLNGALLRHRLILRGSLGGLESVKTPRDLYRTFSQGKGAGLYGEKSPIYCSRLRQLARRFPNARFILLWRDPVEIYRSVAFAGRRARFFRHRGWLARLIFQHEQMIRQGVDLQRAGFRVHHVTYSDLIDNTEEVCRGLCAFLGIKFDRKMLDLSSADFSAIDHSPQHEHLRRGLVERREFPEEEVNPRIVEKLRRFQTRWIRLGGKCFGTKHELSAHPEPNWAERLCYKVTGRFLWTMHSVKRVLFEFLPLAWLRTYRELKEWFLAGQVAAPSTRRPPKQQFSENCVTVLTSYAILASVAFLDYVTGPHVSVGPFYLIPCAMLTTVIGGRWGTCAAAIAAGTWSLVHSLEQNCALDGVALWNCLMRFVLLEIVVLLLSRIRIETLSRSRNA